MNDSKLNKKNLTLFLILIIVIFFSGATSFIFWKLNKSLPDNIVIEIESPKEIKAGELFDLDIKVSNKNRFFLNEAELTLVYSQGILLEESDKNSNLVSKKIDLGKIGKKEKIERNFKMRAFGFEGEEKEFKIIFTPKVPFIFQIFKMSPFIKKEITHKIKIKEVPIVFESIFPLYLKTEMEDSWEIKYQNFSDYDFSGVRIRAEYPKEFEILEVIPAPASPEDKNIWSPSILESMGKNQIAIKGKFKGKPKQEKKFDVFLEWLDPIHSQWNLLLKKSFVTKLIESPIQVKILVNGKENNFGHLGEKLEFQLVYQNNFSEEIKDVSLVAELNGELLDLKSLDPHKGIKTKDGKIYWTSSNISELKSLLSGEKDKKLTFSAFLVSNPVPIIRGGAFTRLFNPQEEKIFKDVLLKIKVESRNPPPFLKKEVIKEEIVKVIPITSDLLAEASSNYSSGSSPSKRGEETIYEISWQAATSLNDLKEVKVITTLPDWTRFIKMDALQVQPENLSEFSYDQTNKKVIWRLKTLPTNTSALYPLTSFNVKFLVGITPPHNWNFGNIIGETYISGVDSYTGEQISITLPAQILYLEDIPSVLEKPDIF